jgi:hypothetical protein
MKRTSPKRDVQTVCSSVPGGVMIDLEEGPFVIGVNGISGIVKTTLAVWLERSIIGRDRRAVAERCATPITRADP